MLSCASPSAFWINPEISNLILPIVTEDGTDKEFIPESTLAGNKSSAVDQPITNACDGDSHLGWERQAGDTKRSEYKRKASPHVKPGPKR